MKKIKVLTAKLGFDIHSRGITVVNRLLRDTGMEVVYLGNQYPETIVAAALDEDVDIIAIGSLSSTGLDYAQKLMNLLKEKNAADIPVVFGGIVLPDELERLDEIGLVKYFPPGSDLDEMAQDFINLGTQKQK